MKRPVILLLLVLTLAACQPAPTPETSAPTLPPLPQTGIDHLLISEVLAGADGNNLHDFIELYNPTPEIIDLRGYALWHILKEGDEESLVHIWDQTSLVPPYGHYLIGQEGQDFLIDTDLRINHPLLPQRGGLILKDPARQVVDSLGWGNAPELTVEGQAAPPMENGVSLERSPGAGAGNFLDTDNNASDFILTDNPMPENSGSSTTPAIPGQPALSVIVPASVPPGASFEYQLTLKNHQALPLTNLTAVLTIPDGLEIATLGEGLTRDGQSITWQVTSLENGAEKETAVTVTAPLSYTTLTTHSYYAIAENAPIAAFGPPINTFVEGGSVPIVTARELIGQEVVVEGIATMYTGGFFAGSGAKFYLDDGTGGVQIYVAGAGNTLRINIGDRVRVQGFITPYRGAIEVVPVSEGLVEVLERKIEDPAPIPVTVRQTAVNGDSLKGALVLVEGTLARAEEFTYSYELDLVDQNGSLLTAYLDKEAGLTIDTISSGDRYALTGIIEGLDDNIRLYPRQQADLKRIFPETIIITVQAPISIDPEEEFVISYLITNHTKENASDLAVSANIPKNVDVIEIGDHGWQEDDKVWWLISDIIGNGGTATVSYKVRPQPGVDNVAIDGGFVGETGLNDEGLQTWQGEIDTNTFTSGLVPIWAIQGEGERSPFNYQTVRTVGTVTGVFPELNGFWIQETATDDDPATSAGLFIFTGGMTIELNPGDLVEVEGLVQEAYLQTQLNLNAGTDITFISANNPLPAPTPLDPPADPAASQAYFESREGMLVTLAGPAVAVAPTSRYGEFAFVLTSHDTERLYRGDETGIVIMADDGSSVVHNDQSTLGYAVTVGDRITNLTGPLAYNYSNYKIAPTSTPAILSGGKQITPQDPIAENQFSIMTWNVENLFDVLDPHPDSPPLPTVSEYRQQITKVAQTILDAGLPTIIGLQEVENIGVLEKIADHELIRAYGYIPVLIEGTDSRYIDVGYLVRGDRAEVIAEEQFPAPEGITSRPPLLVHVRLTGTDTDIFLLNNHFTSMSGGEAATEPRRNAQAAWNVEVLKDILADNPGALLAVLGDLNSYYDSLPIDTLRSAGLVHSFDRIPPEERYTYVYEGVSQTIDHILTTPELDALISEVVVLHFNSDYPLPMPGDVSVMHKSDHDPVLVIFDIE